MRSALVASAAAALAIGMAAPALSESPTNDTTVPAVTPDPCAHHRHPAAEQRHLAKRSFALKRWRDLTPAKKIELGRMQLLRHCAPRHARPSMRRYWDRSKARFHLYRSYRQIAPYRGYSGPDIWKRWLAVPKYITDCESGGDWFAYNSSGASYLYQLLGWGAPYPSSPAAKVANHRIAAQVWAGGSGASNWACA